MSTSININRKDLINALMCVNHIAGCPHQYGHIVAYNQDTEDAHGRVIGPMNISSAGGYMENYLSEVNLDVQEFLDNESNYSYMWGDLNEIRRTLDLDEDAEITEDQESPFT